MNKNSYNRDIKRRLIALLTIAVFVFVMGFCPIDTVAAEDVGEPETVDGLETLDEPETVENAEPQYQTGGMGYNPIPEFRDSLTIDKSDEPSYLKKKEKNSGARCLTFMSLGTRITITVMCRF